MKPEILMWISLIGLLILAAITVFLAISKRKIKRQDDNTHEARKSDLNMRAEIPPGGKISLAKMPSTSPDLFGREKELEMLDKAWEDTKTNIVTLVAFGGVGKTALVNKWLNKMKEDDYRKAERVLAWSFYSQGAAEGKQASADQFIAFALEWFDDSDPSEGSPWDKGERLASLVKQYRTLLILDGLEPLQNPSDCRIKDPALCYLLKELAHDNKGLCVVTTRLELDDIKDDVGNSVEKIELENLSPEAGAQLLEKLGVKGTPEELKQAVDDLGGHALALTLLGTYLKTVYKGDVHKRESIPKIPITPNRQGEHARHIMESYERLYEGKPELNILYIMGLFDKPAEGGAIEAVRKEPIIDGLTDDLKGLSLAGWMFAIANLRTARLLADEDKNDPDKLDCHPLVREHFGEKLKATNPKAWKEAHSRLYEWYKSIAKEYPETIEEMSPLYSAVSHGCQAGYYAEVLKDVYRLRILRESQYFSTDRLGAFGIDLAALSGFFEKLWNQPVGELDKADKGFVLHQAGFRLWALGRLEEAIQLIQAGLDEYIAVENWNLGSVAASNLGNIYLLIGNLTQALHYARKSVTLADRSGDAIAKMARLTTLVNCLLQVGDIESAAITFQKAEVMQKETQLYDELSCFWYCELLLDCGNYQEAQIRSEKALSIITRGSQKPINIAFDHLSLGRVYMFKAQIEKGDFSKADEHLAQAVNGLRQSGRQDHLPFGLLARAFLRRIQKEYDRSKHDVDEAFTIASRGGMGLHLADCHLEYARLYFDMGEEKAKEHLATAKEMIDRMGYHRRDRELQELEAKILVCG